MKVKIYKLSTICIFIISIACTAEVKWTKSVGLGINITSGNNDTTLFNANASAQRKSDNTLLKLDILGCYGKKNKQKTNDRIYFSETYNNYFAKKTYWFANLSAERNRMTDVDLRITTGPGLGYSVIKTDRTILGLEAGGTYVVQKFSDNTKKNYMSLQLSDSYSQKIGEKSKLWQSLQFLPDVSDFSTYLIQAEIGIEVAVTDKLSLKIIAQNTYNSQPPAGKKKNDLSMSTLLAWNF